MYVEVRYPEQQNFASRVLYFLGLRVARLGCIFLFILFRINLITWLFTWPVPGNMHARPGMDITWNRLGTKPTVHAYAYARVG